MGAGGTCEGVGGSPKPSRLHRVGSLARNLNFGFSGSLGMFENMLLLHKNSVLLESLGLSVVSVSFSEVVLMAMGKKKNKNQQLGK